MRVERVIVPPRVASATRAGLPSGGAGIPAPRLFDGPRTQAETSACPSPVVRVPTGMSIVNGPRDVCGNIE